MHRDAARIGRRLLAAAACLLGLLAVQGARAAGPVPLGEEFQVNTHADGIQQTSAVALSALGTFVVVWQSEVEGSGDEIRAQRFDARGVPAGDEIAVNTRSAGNQNAPVVAMNAAGDFVVAWQSMFGGNYAIRARCFDATGAARGEELAVSTARGESQSAPAVAMDARGGFVVAWERPLRGSYEIRARRFDARGAARGAELAVNAVSASAQRAPSVAMAAVGDFVVAWRSNVEGSFEIRAQRFSAQDVARGEEIAVNALTAGDQLAPRVAADADGDFVVVWENALDDRFEIRARRFNAQGAARESERAVHPASAGDQFAPAVAMEPDGDFVVAWHRQVDGGHELRARAFAASGQARGDELAVNTQVAGHQKAAALALNARGALVVSWHSDASGGWEVAARRFQTAPATQRIQALAPMPRAPLDHTPR